ncbi:MAG: pyrroline-5-carboxylate reductase [Armatimonadetes bacterium]|nr:pyrroline-5-carboxylate reductase [Armatimonadota bacterium]
METAIGFIGAGNFTEAMIRGLRAAGIDGGRILATTRSRFDRVERFHTTWGIVAVRNKADLVASAPTLILAMKPQDLKDAMAELSPLITDRHLVITVLAGVRCATIEGYVSGAPVVRAMPNLPMAVQASTTALAYGRDAAPEHRSAAKALFALVGDTFEVNEDLMDAVTALSGSGPAYVYLMMEALIDVSLQVGFSLDTAKDMAVQTIFGTAKLVKETGADPADLRRRVTSPGGTTAAGLAVLEERGFRAALIDAVLRATERARELGSR